MAITVPKTSSVETQGYAEKFLGAVNGVMQKLGTTSKTAAFLVLAGCVGNQSEKKAPDADVALKKMAEEKHGLAPVRLPIRERQRLLNVIATPEEVETDLRKEWEIKPPTPTAMYGNAESLDRNPKGKIDREVIELQDEALLGSKKKYPEKLGGIVSVSFTWTWVEGEIHGDDLWVYLRTDCSKRELYSRAPNNGLMLRISPSWNGLFLSQWGGPSERPLASATAPAEMEKLKRGKAHNFRIVDHGNRIDLYCGNGQVPILSANAPPLEGQNGGEIAFKNNAPKVVTHQRSIVEKLIVTEIKSRPREDLTIRSRE